MDTFNEDGYTVGTDDAAAKYDPATEACSPYYHVIPCTCTLPLNGPGGNINLRENNEKGILETNLSRVIAMHQYADLSSDHDSQRQGIYRTNSVGDRD